MKAKKLILGLSLAATLGGALIATSANAAVWNNHTVIHRGHHRVVINEHCHGNRFHRVCHINKHRVYGHRYW